MENSIAKSFTFSSLIKFTMPSIVMLIFLALYTIVDGVFISRFVSTDALSAFNIIYPFINVVIAIGVMLATGSSAVIAKKLGEGKEREAKENFTLIMLLGLILGIIITVIGFVFCKQIISILGSTKELDKYCLDYFYVALIFMPTYITNLLFQYLTITSGKPNIGLIFTVIGGLTNIILDYVFIVPMGMGISGAALATGLGNLIPTVLGTIYFFRKKEVLYFVKPKLDIKMILQTCANGSSEMVTNLSSGVTTMLFNIVIMKYLGSDGVAAISIVLYGQFLITSVYIGFSSGVAPIISYNYGSENKKELKKVVRYSAKFILISSIILLIIALTTATYIVSVFTPKGTHVYEIGYNGFRIFSISFLVSGVNIFASAMFTAFSNGIVSATISFLRTFLFIVAGILILPKLIGVNGIWLAVPLAELLTIIISLIYINKYKGIYGYEKEKNNKSYKDLKEF